MKRKLMFFCTSVVSILMVSLMLGFTVQAGQSSGSYIWKNANENSGTDFWKASYSYFDGLKKRSLVFSEDCNNECILQIDVTTLSGELDITIIDTSGTELYSYENIDTSQFDVELSDKGDYQIRIDGRKHEGSFSVKSKTTKS